MGHPKKLRKKWRRPLKPFDKTRIKAEVVLKRTYGFRRKREIWRLDQEFKNYSRRGRRILATKDKDSEKVLLEKLVKLGLLKKNAKLDDALSLTLEDFCNRRLQTIVHKKGIAGTVKEARQMIVHKKVFVSERIIDQPNYLVSVEEEGKIKLKPKPKKKLAEKPKPEAEVQEEKEEAVEPEETSK